MFKKSLAQAYYNFSTLLGAGVPLLRALDNVSRGHDRVSRAFRRVRESVEAGDPMAGAMRDQRIFEPFDVAVVNVGETSGDLPETLRELARWYEFTHRMKMLMLVGCIYPALIFHMGALIAPVPSVALGGVGLRGYIESVAGILAVLYVPALVVFAVVKLTPRRGPLRLLLDTFLSYIPGIGQTLQRLALSRFTRAFHIATRAGVPYIDCMQMAVDMTGNEVVARKLGGGLAAVRVGESMSQGFSRSLPFDFVEVWKVGEETGDMDDVTGRLADQMQFSAEMRIQMLARALPWVIYVAVMMILVYHVFQGAMTVYGGLTTGEAFEF